MAVVQAPRPFGRVAFANHLPDWQLDHEHEREVQTVAAARFLEKLAADGIRHLIVAGGLDATPDAATVRSWTGRRRPCRRVTCQR